MGGALGVLRTNGVKVGRGVHVGAKVGGMARGDTAKVGSRTDVDVSGGGMEVETASV